LAPDVATKCLLILTWICAGRVGDVAKLQRHEIIMEKDFMTPGATTDSFCQGKASTAVKYC
jgi:hypothetical protein